MGRRAGTTAEETRAQLVHAAAQVFADSGYEGARVGEIAKRAGFTTGAIYAHYRTKEDLLADAIRSHGRGALEQLLASGEAHTLVEALRRAGTSLPRRATRRGALVMEAIGAARRDPGVADVLSKSIGGRERALAELVRRAQREDELDPDLSADALARLCMVLVLGSLVVGALGLAPADPQQWSAVVDRLIDTVTPDAPRPSKESRR